MKRFISVLVVLLLAISFLAGCGGAPAASDNSSGGGATEGSAGDTSGGGNESGGDEKIVIGAAFAGVDIGFWSTDYEGLESKAAELGAEVNLVIAESDANKQNDQIRNLIAQSVDVIVVAPVDGSAVASAVKEAQSVGIPVVMNNRPLQSEDVEADMAILSDNELMAYNQLTWLADKAREDGTTYNILLLVGGLGDENAVQRLDGHRRAVDENSDVLSIAVEIPTDWKTEAALAGVQNSMQAYSDINCIVSPSDYFITPIQSALEQINRWQPIGEADHMTLLTFDGDVNAMKGLEEGYIDCTAIQDAFYAGAKSAEWAVKLANGETAAEKVDLDPGILATSDNFEEIRDDLWGWQAYQAQ